MLSSVRVMTRERAYKNMSGGGTCWATPSGDGRKRIPQSLVLERPWQGTLTTPSRPYLSR